MTVMGDVETGLVALVTLVTSRGNSGYVVAVVVDKKCVHAFV